MKDYFVSLCILFVAALLGYLRWLDSQPVVIWPGGTEVVITDTAPGEIAMINIPIRKLRNCVRDADQSKAFMI